MENLADACIQAVLNLTHSKLKTKLVEEYFDEM